MILKQMVCIQHFVQTTVWPGELTAKVEWMRPKNCGQVALFLLVLAGRPSGKMEELGGFVRV